MFKKPICFLMCIIMLITLTACWDRKEPRSLALITSVIYDLDETQGYHLTLEVRNPSSGSSSIQGNSNQGSSITVSGYGETVAQALRNASVVLERTIFGGQNKARFLSEKLAKQEVYGIMDLFTRDFLTDERSFIVIVKNEDPTLIYETKISLSDVVGDHIEELNENQVRMGSKSVFISTLEFLQDLLNEGKQPVAGVVEVVSCDDINVQDSSSTGGDQEKQENIQNTRLEYQGIAAFKDGKLVGYFNGIEARAYNLIANEIKTMYMSVAVEDSVVAANSLQTKSNIKVKKTPENFVFDIDVGVRLKVVQVDGPIDVMNMEKQIVVEEQFNEKIKTEIQNAVTKAQTEFESDIFGFGDYIHKQLPAQWKEIKSNWGELFPKAKINIKVNSAIMYTGDVKSPIEKDIYDR